MCLFYNEQSSLQMRKKIEDERIIFYKIYRIGTNEDGGALIFEPFRGGEVKLVSDGFVVSNRPGVELNSDEKISKLINLGIHVYCEQNQSLEWDMIQVPVEVNASDFVGCDMEGRVAVFCKIKVNSDLLHKLAIAKAEYIDTYDDWDDEEDDYDESEDQEDQEDEEDEDDDYDEEDEDDDYDGDDEEDFEEDEE